MKHLSPIFQVCFVLLGLLSSFSVEGQHTAKWLIGGSGGQTIYQGDISQKGFGSLRGSTIRWGGSVHYRPNDYWSFGVESYHGKLMGADRFYPADDYRMARNFEFTTTLTDVALTSRIYPFGQRRLQPELGLGLGVVFFSAEAFLLDNMHLELADFIKDDLENEQSDPIMIFPLRVGFAYQLTQSLALQTGLVYTFTETDFIDGVSFSGNPADNDRYGHLYLGARLSLGNISDLDKDGIADIDDLCPLKPGPALTRGCPDSDGDGIKDSVDRCPLAAGDPFYGGCPDTDEDGTADPDDRCPTLAGPPEALGCPPKDTDGDGVLDHLDDCPLLAGTQERRGCPTIDTDQDGLLDEDDRCPEQYGIPLFQGCPDTDGDGIEDNKDACPNTFGYFDENGCPRNNSPAKEAAILGQQQLFFRENSADLSNFNLLDRLVQFMQQNPAYHLSISGHADGDNREEAAGYISLLRAERVKRYLVDSGVPVTRIFVRGYSSREPLENARFVYQNRRVEFKLTLHY